MSNRRKIGADYLNTALFDDPPKIAKDIPKFLADVEVYVLNVLGEYGSWKTPSLEWLELENNIFGDAEESDFTIPANVLIAKKIFLNIQFAKSFYKKGKIDKACFYIGTIVELLHAPIKQKHTNLQNKYIRKEQSENKAVELEDRNKKLCEYAIDKKEVLGWKDCHIAKEVWEYFKDKENYPKSIVQYRKILKEGGIL